MDINTVIMRSMRNMAEMLTGMRIALQDCTSEQALAYCYKEKSGAVIAVAFRKNFPDLDEDGKKCILYGLFAHEVMHLLRTDFAYEEQKSEHYKPSERKERHKIFNIFEDPAIEYFSGNSLSKFLCRCLHKTIEYFYRNAPGIDECGGDAYLQYINAMVLFGDMGVIKGSFTFPEAKDAFVETAPMALKLIEEPNGKKRYDIAQQIFDKICPLWSEHNENVFGGSEMEDLLDKLGITDSKGNADSKNPSESGDSGESDSDVSKRRRKIVQILEAAESDGSPSDESALDETSSGVSVNQGEDGAALSKDKIGQELSALSKQTEKEMEREFSIPAALSEEIKNALEASEKLLEKEIKREQEQEEQNAVDIPVRSPYYGEIKYQTYKEEQQDPDKYQEYLELLRPDISNFKSRLRNIFHNQYSRKDYKTKGKINIPRYCGRKVSARIFEKRTVPDDKANLAVEIMVDQSGSMNQRMEFVTRTVILITESLDEFHIPVKVVGFTTLKADCDADYYHYINWKNNRESRRKIPFMRAGGGTFLGHAIRYGGELIKKRQEQKKLYIVLTDGAPSHKRYANQNDGLKDCRNAVKEISQFSEIIGIGLFQNEKDSMIFQDIFGEKAVIVRDIQDLVRELPRKIGKLLSRP